MKQSPVSAPGRFVAVPLRETVCGLPGALSVTESVPLKLPETPGVKVTLIVQLAPGGRLEPQVLVSAKLVVAVMLVMLSAVLPLLVSVTDCGGLAVPTNSLQQKTKLVADNVALGPSETLGSAAKYPEISSTRWVGFVAHALIEPLLVGTIAMLLVMAASSAFSVATSGCASPCGQSVR